MATNNITVSDIPIVNIIKPKAPAASMFASHALGFAIFLAVITAFHRHKPANTLINGSGRCAVKNRTKQA